MLVLAGNLKVYLSHYMKCFNWERKGNFNQVLLLLIQNVDAGVSSMTIDIPRWLSKTQVCNCVIYLRVDNNRNTCTALIT